jgi:hypothetical protein
MNIDKKTLENKHNSSSNGCHINTIRFQKGDEVERFASADQI